MTEQTFRGVKYAFFWDGVFSNWHPSDFSVGGVWYNCGEQYMMHQKALTFNDEFSALKVLKQQSPSRQKQIGREVVGFIDSYWNVVKYNLVKVGLREKFSQNPALLEYLRCYKGFTVVEASPEDRVWGIGFYEQYAIENFDNWGENLLGKIITELADELE